MCPLSGLSSPRQSFRIVLFPEPATPISVLVSPRFNSKDTPSSSGGPSNSMRTLSKMIALWTVSGRGFSRLNNGDDIIHRGPQEKLLTAKDAKGAKEKQERKTEAKKLRMKSMGPSNKKPVRTPF